MTKADMINAEFWDRLWDIYGDQCGGIRAIRFGGGLELVFDPPITRGSYSIPGDFPARRSDEGAVYVFGVHPIASVRPGASGGPTGALQGVSPDAWVSPVGGSSDEARARRMANPEYRKAWIERFGEDYGEPPLVPPPEPESGALFGKRRTEGRD